MSKWRIYFNIYDLVKSNDSSGGSSDVSVVLVQNLEKKVFKKFEFIDEKSKKHDEEGFKVKNDMSNIKNTIEAISKNVINLKLELENGFYENNIVIENHKDQLNDLENKIDGLNKKIFDGLENKSQTLKENNDGLLKVADETSNNNIDDKSKKSQNISEGDTKLLKDCSKKVLDLEKNFKVFVNSLNIDNIRNEISKLNDQVGNKLNSSEVTDMKENMSKEKLFLILFKILAQLNTQITFIKDSISQLLEDRKMIDDINWLRKKVENLSASVMNMKNLDDSHNNSTIINRAMPLDNAKYLELHTFNEFQKTYHKDYDGLKRITDELSRFVDDIITALKSKAGDKDMKNLEDYLTSKIEELKLNSQKKFADKLETSKNIKYLDAQVKHIIDVYIKKMEKGDNWLIAKKPVNGFACASCESYIGDLQDNNQHIPWNKYPIRDPNDKAYRVRN